MTSMELATEAGQARDEAREDGLAPYRPFLMEMEGVPYGGIGVRIISVEAGSRAEQAELKKDDVIIWVMPKGGEDYTAQMPGDLDDITYTRAMHLARSSQSVVNLLIRRGSDRKDIEVLLEDEEPEDSG